MMYSVGELCQAWNLAPLLTTRTPETGTIHQTLLLETVDGRYALRTYRYTYEERWRVVVEHELSAYAYARGLPAITPLSLPNGDTFIEHDGRIHALFPFARGYQTRRGHITPEETIAMGAFLAQMHRVLHDYPEEKTAIRSFTFDHEATLQKISEIEAAILALPQPDDVDMNMLTRLQQRRAWLETTPAPDETAFAQLEHQVIHGDYQETNLFFEHGVVSAIIDWDQAYPAPRAWEVLRALHYIFQFDPAPCHLFLQAYRRELPLSSEELDVAANMYSWKRTHDLWLQEEYYLRGNQRVREFFSPHEFTPLIERWNKLQDALKTQFS